jgi:uncharacterized membrane-anchored protein
LRTSDHRRDIQRLSARHHGKKQRDPESIVAAINAATKGPADVLLRELATIHLANSYSFIPINQGAALMRAMGNTTDENFYGLVISNLNDQNWFVAIDYRDSGHIREDDAKSWNAHELWQSIKDGTEASTKERAERDFPAPDVVGWAEPPAYDAAAHRLVWSMLAKERGSAAQAATVNYNTYALGRQGYFELNLVTNEDAITEVKNHAGVVLAALEYTPGERYTDLTHRPTGWRNMVWRRSSAASRRRSSGSWL